MAPPFASGLAYVLPERISYDLGLTPAAPSHFLLYRDQQPARTVERDPLVTILPVRPGCCDGGRWTVYGRRRDEQSLTSPRSRALQAIPKTGTSHDS